MSNRLFHIRGQWIAVFAWHTPTTTNVLSASGGGTISRGRCSAQTRPNVNPGYVAKRPEPQVKHTQQDTLYPAEQLIIEPIILPKSASSDAKTPATITPTMRIATTNPPRHSPWHRLRQWLASMVRHMTMLPQSTFVSVESLPGILGHSRVPPRLNTSISGKTHVHPGTPQHA